jgi:hypothetical protein
VQSPSLDPRTVPTYWAPGNAINATDRIKIWSNGFDFGCPDAASGAPEDRVRKLDFARSSSRQKTRGFLGSKLNSQKNEIELGARADHR